MPSHLPGDLSSKQVFAPSYARRLPTCTGDLLPTNKYNVNNIRMPLTFLNKLLFPSWKFSSSSNIMHVLHISVSMCQNIYPKSTRLCSWSGRQMSRTLAAIVGGAAGAVALVGIVIVILWFCIFHKRSISRTSETGSSDPSIQGDCISVLIQIKHAIMYSPIKITSSSIWITCSWKNCWDWIDLTRCQALPDRRIVFGNKRF